MPEWKKYKLGEIITLNYGKSLIEKNRISGDIPVYGSSGITGWHNIPLIENKGIIVGRKGTVGSIYKANGSFYCIDTAYYIEPNDSEYNFDYLYYLLQTLNLDKLNFDSAVPGLNRDVAYNQEISLPPLPTQHRIAEILGALDDKIELNLQMNKTLEEMAMALYKNWFVDFGPFKTGEFVDSELGMIPKGWEVSDLQSHYNAAKGLSYKGKNLSIDNNDIPMHNLNSINEGGYYKYEGIKFYNGDFQERHKVFPGELIVANTEQGHKYLLIGSPALVPAFFGDFGIFSHHIYRLRAKTDSYLTSKYLYYNLLYKPFRTSVTAFCNGTTVNMLQKEGLMQPKILVPPKQVIIRFEEFVSELILLSEYVYSENQSLIQTRDYLLPKLISGEIEVN